MINNPTYEKLLAEKARLKALLDDHGFSYATDYDPAMARTGARIIYSAKQTLTATLIDKSTVWYGSINPLGFTSADDTAIKLSDPTIAGEILGTLFSYVNIDNHG